MKTDPKAVNPPFPPLPAYLGDPFAPANRRGTPGVIRIGADDTPADVERKMEAAFAPVRAVIAAARRAAADPAQAPGHNRRSRKGGSDAGA